MQTPLLLCAYSAAASFEVVRPSFSVQLAVTLWMAPLQIRAAVKRPCDRYERRYIVISRRGLTMVLPRVWSSMIIIVRAAKRHCSSRCSYSVLNPSLARNLNYAAKDGMMCLVHKIQPGTPSESSWVSSMAALSLERPHCHVLAFKPHRTDTSNLVPSINSNLP